MSYTLIMVIGAVGLFGGMLLMVEVGRLLGQRRLRLDPEGMRAGAGPVEAAAFGLYGLLIAFTFSGAAARFDQRRHLVIEEANAIGTTYLRLDLLPPEYRGQLKEDFRNYLDSRIAIYRLLPDLAAARAELDRSNGLQAQLWSDAVRASQGSQVATMLLLPALNGMIDLTATRTAATLMHPHPVMLAMLFAFSLGCSLLVGYSTAVAKVFNWLHTLAFVLITSITVYVIIDMEYPRIGLIQVSAIDQLLVDLRNSMK